MDHEFNHYGEKIISNHMMKKVKEFSRKESRVNYITSYRLEKGSLSMLDY